MKNWFAEGVASKVNDFNTYYVVPLLGSEKEGGRSGALGEIVACNNISYTYSIPNTVYIWDIKFLVPAAWFMVRSGRGTWNMHWAGPPPFHFLVKELHSRYESC